MTAFLAAAYVLIGLLVARKVYGAIRAREIHSSGSESFEGDLAVLIAIIGVLAGAMWPGAIVVGAIIYKPRKAPEELKAERDTMARRIHELEIELGIREPR